MIARGRRRSFQRRILDWYATHGRDLPWRRTRDPYAILVSEVLSHQTQIARVLPVYERLLEQYPTATALASPSATPTCCMLTGDIQTSCS